MGADGAGTGGCAGGTPKVPGPGAGAGRTITCFTLMSVLAISGLLKSLVSHPWARGVSRGDAPHGVA